MTQTHRPPTLGGRGGRAGGPVDQRIPPAADALDLLRSELGATVVDTEAELKERRAQAHWYTRTLWGSAEGFAVIALGHGGRIGPTGTYKFEHFTQRFFRWPDERERFLEVALNAAEDDDVYTCPLLRSEPSRRKGTGLSSRWLWLDLDERPTLEGVRVLRRLMVRGSFEVSSGRGRHVYCKLRRPQPAATLEALNRRIAVAVGADAKWSEDSLLRLPGCWNHKQRATTGSQLVRLRYLSPHKPMDLAS